MEPNPPSTEPPKNQPDCSESPKDLIKGKALRETLAAYGTISGSLIFVAIAFLLAALTGVSPLSSFAFTPAAIIWGVGATLPMLLLLVGLEKISHPSVKLFREQQVKFFAGLGFKFTPFRIIAMSLGAGIGEELLFRGALQGWLALHLPILVAILIPSILFGLMHNVNKIYMVIAGLISLYLGMVFVVSDNILAPIIAHTLYDIIALAYTAHLIEQFKANGVLQ